MKSDLIMIDLVIIIIMNLVIIQILVIQNVIIELKTNWRKIIQIDLMMNLHLFMNLDFK